MGGCVCCCTACVVSLHGVCLCSVYAKDEYDKRVIDARATTIATEVLGIMVSCETSRALEQHFPSWARIERGDTRARARGLP